MTTAQSTTTVTYTCGHSAVVIDVPARHAEASVQSCTTCHAAEHAERIARLEAAEAAGKAYDPDRVILTAAERSRAEAWERREADRDWQTRAAMRQSDPSDLDWM